MVWEGSRAKRKGTLIPPRRDSLIPQDDVLSPLSVYQDSEGHRRLRPFGRFRQVHANSRWYTRAKLSLD